MAVLTSNNGQSRLASALTTGATSLSVTSGEGAKFPALAAVSGNWFPLTIVKASGALEIVRCTARTNDVFTVTRAQEGTAAQAFSAGDRIELRITAAYMAEFMQSANFTAYGLSFLNLVNAAAGRTLLALGNAAILDMETDPLGLTNNPIKYGAFGLGNSVTIAAGTNLNAVTQPGIYSFTSGATPINSPISGAFTMTVEGRAAYPHQVLKPIYGQPILHRSAKVANPSTSAADWSAWDRLYSTENTDPLVQTFLASASYASMRAALSLGTAAITNVTANNADRTAGRVTKNGDKQTCTAWVNFDGTGTVSMRDNINVSSITDNGVGDYTVNLTTALANTNYSFCFQAIGSADGAWVNRRVVSKTVSALRVSTGGTSSFADSEQVSCIIFGGVP